MEPEQRPDQGGFSVFGLVLVVIGGLFLLREVGVVPDISLWTVLWFGIGGWLAISRLRGSEGTWFWPLGFIAAGTFQLLRDLGQLPSGFRLWPVIVIVLGVSLLVGGADQRRRSIR